MSGPTDVVRPDTLCLMVILAALATYWIIGRFIIPALSDHYHRLSAKHFPLGIMGISVVLLDW